MSEENNLGANNNYCRKSSNLPYLDNSTSTTIRTIDRMPYKAERNFREKNLVKLILILDNNLVCDLGKKATLVQSICL